MDFVKGGPAKVFGDLFLVFAGNGNGSAVGNAVVLLLHLFHSTLIFCLQKRLRLKGGASPHGQDQRGDPSGPGIFQPKWPNGEHATGSSSPQLGIRVRLWVNYWHFVNCLQRNWTDPNQRQTFSTRTIRIVRDRRDVTKLCGDSAEIIYSTNFINAHSTSASTRFELVVSTETHSVCRVSGVFVDGATCIPPFVVHYASKSRVDETSGKC